MLFVKSCNVKNNYRYDKNNSEGGGTNIKGLEAWKNPVSKPHCKPEGNQKHENITQEKCERFPFIRDVH